MPGHFQKAGKGIKPAFIVGGGIVVPGTDFLADVAAENPALDLFPVYFREYIMFAFDGEIRQAPAGINRTAIQDGPGGTGFNAIAALDTVVRVESDLKSRIVRLRVMTPDASQRTTLEKDSGSDSGAVVQCVSFDIDN